MKLTFICNSLYTFGGGERWALEVATRLKKEFEITIVSPKGKKLDKRISLKELSKDYNINGIKIVDIESFSVSASSFKYDRFPLVIPKVKGISKLSKIIKESDVIYLMSYNPILITSSILLANRYKKELILGVHNPTFPKAFSRTSSIRQKALNKGFVSLLKKVRYFHVLNVEYRDIIKKHYPNARIFLIPVFIYRKKPKPRSGFSKRFIVLFVGRLETAQKGIDMLQKIIESVLSINDKIEFHIVGGRGDGEPLLKSIASKYRDNIIMKGYLPDKDHEAEFRNADLFISTSRYETFPAAVLDAQSYGLYTVAFDVVGVNTIIQKSFQGLLIKQFDTNMFSDAIVKAYVYWSQNKNKYNYERRKISNEIYSHYSAEYVLPILSKMFQEVK